MTFGNKIISGLLWGQIGSTGRTLLCFLFSIIVARLLGVQNYGIYVALASFVELLAKFSDMGVFSIFTTYIPRFKIRSQPGECSFVVRTVIITRLILVMVAIGFLFVFAGALIDYIGEPSIGDYLVLIAIWFLVRSIMDGFIAIVIANVDMKFYAAVELLVSIFQVAGALLLIKFGMEIRSVVILMILVNGIQLISYGMASLTVIKPKPLRTRLTPVFRFSLVMWLSTIIQYFRFKSIGVFMLLYFLKDSKSVAYYDVAFFLSVSAGSILLAAVDRLILPFYSEAYVRAGLTGLKNAWEFMTKLSIFLSAPILVFLIFHSEDIVKIFYSNRYLESSPLIIVFAIFALGGIFVAGGPAVSVFFPLNKENYFLYLRGFNGILNVVLNLILIPNFGIMGAVIATSGSTLLTNVIELGLALRILNARLPYEFMMKLSLFMLISISWTLFFMNMNLFQLVSVAFAYGVLITALMSRFYNFSDREKEIIREFSPGFFSFLTRYKLLKL